MKLKFSPLAVAFAFLIGAGSVFADSVPKVDIEQKLQFVASTWGQKNSEAVVKKIYTKDTEITGEGVEEVYSGQAALTGLIDHLKSTSKSTVIHLNRFVQLEDNTAYTWVTWDITPSDAAAPFKMKSLFVWKRIAGEWFVVADMFANGEIPRAN